MSYINHCYDTYLSKTRKNMIIVNIGLETPIKGLMFL